MPMTDLARNGVAGLIIGSGTSFNNANAYLGVGDSNDAFDPAETDLQGANKERKPMKGSFPVRNDNEISFEARFLEEDAVFNWREVAIFNAAVDGLMLTRILADQGSKPDNEIWDYEVKITVLHGAE